MSFVRVKSPSLFRKIALSLWGSGGDPSVYGFVDIDVTELAPMPSVTSVVIKGLGELMQKHKELGFIIRFGKLYRRKAVNISVMVNIVDGDHHDLSFATLRDVDRLSVVEIERLLTKDAGLIRRREDPHLGFALRLIRFMPHRLTGAFLWLFSFLKHDLNWNLSFLRLPPDPFGSVIVTNVGSLGIKRALVPLVPLTRAGLLVSIGQITKEAVVIDDKIVVRKIMHLGVTFDHRLFDGAQAARMIRDFEAFLKKGEWEAADVPPANPGAIRRPGL